MPEIVLWKRGFHNGFTNITDRTMKANAYIPALTGVRAIAAFLVFFHHANQAEFPFPLFRVLNEFHIGVTVFFVLSGFLICLRYYDTCEITGAWFRKYLKNRIARIYPMYMVLTLGTFAYAWYTNDESIYNGFTWHWGVLLMNIFFFRGFFDDLKFTGVAQGWSLTVEECFYFSAPFFFRQIKKDKLAMIYLPLLVLGIGVLLVAIFSNFNWWGFYGNYRFNFLYTFTGRCTEFFIGMYLALYMLKQKDAPKYQFPWVTLLGFAVICGAMAIMTSIPLTESMPFGLYHPWGIFSNNVLLPIGVCLFFYGAIMERSIIRWFLSTKLMDLLGKSSYIYYLVHIGFIATISHHYSEIWTDAFYAWLDANEFYWLSANIPYAVVSIGIVFILLNIVSIILYKLIEEPMNHYIRKSSLLEKKVKPAV